MILLQAAMLGGLFILVVLGLTGLGGIYFLVPLFNRLYRYHKATHSGLRFLIYSASLLSSILVMIGICLLLLMLLDEFTADYARYN